MSHSLAPADLDCNDVGDSTHRPKSVAHAALTGPAKASDMMQKAMRTKYRTSWSYQIDQER